MTWRIRGRPAFRALGRFGQRARTTSLWCTYLDDPTAVPLRVAYSVGRPVGPATQRNRVRRRLRAIVSTLTVEHRLDHGLLLIGVAPTVAERTFGELSAEMSVLLDRASRAPAEPGR